MYSPPPPPKKSRKGLWITLGIIAAVMVFGCIGVSLAVTSASKSVSTSVATAIATTSNSTSSGGNAPSGQVKSVGGALTLDGVTATLTSAKVYNGGQYNTPNPGYEYILVHVTLVNTSGNDHTYGSSDFHIRSGSGNITDTDALTYDQSLNGLQSGTLSANGGKAEGDLVFQMKTGDHKAKVTWQPNFLLQGAGDNGWNLGL